MQIDDIQFATLKRCWMKFATMGQVLSAVSEEVKVEGFTARNLGFCIGDISSEINEVLMEITGGTTDERSN